MDTVRFWAKSRARCQWSSTFPLIACGESGTARITSHPPGRPTRLPAAPPSRGPCSTARSRPTTKRVALLLIWSSPVCIPSHAKQVARAHTHTYHTNTHTDIHTQISPMHTQEGTTELFSLARDCPPPPPCCDKDRPLATIVTLYTSFLQGDQPAVV